ncbi:hypothetical protein IP78_14600 [Brevundimonas sp. AAP58]|uniref:DUF1993 domain-containing protein n=1 Tax=Brevundimonas sp. AAP58 TaxID=1523422 RepID=UPI0006B943AB|nr:DUF1993 domain-containing protein [Brevundimonas sp. AAP58]KPF73848.1 hypothetical protein IP78_14600 [Brevundimonas sp. AAP58]
MATELYDLGVPAFTRGLRALDALLDKAVAHAAATGQDAEAWLDTRLAPDMHPLRKQVQIACDSPKLCIARLSGVAAPVHDDSEVTIAELKGRIAQTLAYIASVPRDAIDGQEGKEVVVTFPGGQMTFEGRPYLTGFALPNFYFHLTTAYGLLRQAGVPLSKRDYMGSPG